MSKPKNARQNKKGFVMPEPIPSGEVLTDMTKKQWKLGPSIGKGGFGEIYSACENGSSVKTDKYPYVIKIEPHDNGPLFVEMHFYMRNAKKDDIDSFCKSKKLTTLGMPLYIASGSHVLRNGNKYRFLVMQRFVCDLQTYLRKAGNCLPEHTVIRLALQMIHALEYIHSRTYVHADLKAANILLGSPLNQAYLVDFGLASHYNTKPFKPDPKKMHNGTIEYTSRDAHLGVPTRRGDFEILAYNLIHWLGGVLPWDGNLSNPVSVQNLKNEAANDVTKFLRKCFPKQGPPKYLSEFIKLVFEMGNDAEPEYHKYHVIFESALKSLGKSNKGKFDLDSDSPSVVKSPKGRPKKSFNDSDIIPEEPKLKKARNEISNKRLNTKENGYGDSQNDSKTPVVKTPVNKASGRRIEALKKRNDILEYSICEDEQVEIIVKKTNVKTGAVKTTIRTQKGGRENISDNVRHSPRLISKDCSPSLFSTNEEDSPNSSLEEISPIEKKTRNASKMTTIKRTAENSESKWKNCPTVKASKAGTYLKKSKLVD